MKKIVLAAVLVAAATAPFAQQHGPAPKQAALCDSCGTVQAVHQVKRKGSGGAVGVVGGAVIGGLIGNQFGGGTGRTLATVGGAAAGGYAGNEVQKHVNSRVVWGTRVRMKDGSTRSFEQEARPAWRAGSVVKVSAGRLGLR